MNRLQFANKIIHTSPDELWKKYGISRVSDITGMDILNVPVWISCRPLATTLSLNSGKSLDNTMSKAGAILEAVEFHAGENPHGEFQYCSYKQIPRGYALDWRECPLSRNAVLNDSTLIAWEQVEELVYGGVKYVPSDTIWLEGRVREPFMHFQASSNGISAGVSVEDATESALLECIERDGWTCSEHKARRYVDISDHHSDIIDAVRYAGLVPMVMEATTDIGIPVYGAILLDPTGAEEGAYMGYGCRMNPAEALDRAVLEAVQSRVVYIAGARDDLMRRNFLLLKKLDRSGISSVYRATAKPAFNPAKVTSSIIDRLQSAGFNKVFRKVLHEGTLNGASFAVVKVFVPGLEVPQFDNWHPSKRIK